MTTASRTRTGDPANDSLTLSAENDCADRFRLAEMLEEQASRPQVDDESTSRVAVLRYRAAALRASAALDLGAVNRFLARA